MARPLAVVCVSGGMDSCVTAALAAESFRLAFLHANYGQRTRDAAPVATADKGQPALDTASRRTAHELGHRIVGGAPSPSVRKDAVDAADGRAYLKPGTKARSNAADAMPKLKLGAARPAFEQPQTDAHPYDGLAQRRVGALYWACEEAGQVWFFQDHRQGPRYTLRWYCGRAAATGWRLTGPGLSEGRWLGRTFTTAATAAEDIVLRFKWISDRMDECARQWPKGTRVQGVDSYGVTCMGTVNGVGWGVITADGHENYGKTWVDVTWDEMPHNVATGRRNRPLTDSLIRR